MPNIPCLALIIDDFSPLSSINGCLLLVQVLKTFTFYWNDPNPDSSALFSSLIELPLSMSFSDVLPNVIKLINKELAKMMSISEMSPDSIEHYKVFLAKKTGHAKTDWPRNIEPFLLVNKFFGIKQHLRWSKHWGQQIRHHFTFWQIQMPFEDKICLWLLVQTKCSSIEIQ
jgi:hypothetical protein